MNLFKRLFRRRAAPLPAPPPEYNGSALLSRLLSGSSVEAAISMGDQDKLDAYVGWIYAAVQLISGDVRSASYVLYKKNKDGIRVEITEHPLIRILKRPNPLETGQDLLERSDLILDLMGEVYWLVVTNPRGSVVGIQVVHPTWIERPVVEGGRLVKWIINYPGGQHIEVAARDLIRIHYPHPLDPWSAASPVEAVAASHYFDLYLRAYGATLMRNDGAIPAGILTTKADLTDEDAIILAERWKDRYQRRRDGVAVLHSGATYQPIAIPVSDIDFLKTAQFNRDQILAVYKVPASKLGLVEDVNRANAEVNDRSYKEASLRPRLRRFQDAINTHLLPRFGSSGLIFEFKDPVGEDADVRQKKFALGLSRGAIMVDEFREFIGLDPLPNGKGQFFYVPPGAVPATDPLSVDLSWSKGGKEPAAAAPPEAKALDDDALELAALRWLRAQEPLERRLKSQLRSVFSREQKAVVAAIKAGKVIPDTRDWYDDTRTENDLDEEWLAIIAAAWVIAIADGWELAAAELPAFSLDYDEYIEKAAAYAREHAGEAVAGITSTTRAELGRLIEQALREGWSPDETARRAAELYDGFKGDRAKTIARTETAAALNYAKHWYATEVAQRFGVALTKRWSAINDSRTRFTHALAHGQKKLLNEPFEVGSGLLMYPGDPSGPPQEVINCRCVEVYEWEDGE